MRALVTALLIGILLTQDLIDAELALDLGPWHANAPVADLLALILLPIALLAVRKERFAPPGWQGYALFLLGCLASIPGAEQPGLAAHELLRKPIFMALAYGLGLSWAVARVVDLKLLKRALLISASGIAVLSIAASSGRILAGDALWFEQINWVTPNHKTLAVALAAWMPLLIGLTPQPGARLAIALVAVAIGASASKTAWIALIFGLGWWYPRRNPVMSRPLLALPLLASAIALAVYAPLLLESKAMLDAARSRHSLDVRSWEMFTDSPLVGAGTGMSVVHEMVTFPHYRVNGVDAHGVIQKIGSETGLFGLAGYGWFTFATGAALARRWRARSAPLRGLDWGIVGTWTALQLNLLLSTETFSPTHWVPLAVCWGLANREELREELRDELRDEPPS